MTHIHPDLVRADDRIIPNDTSEIRLFTVVRDESLRLPYFLDYYRRMGVKRFFVINNLSKDGTREFLLAQPDCHVFDTEASYLATKAGLAWLNPLMDAYGSGHWIVCCDADELIVYQNSDTHNLPYLCRWLDNIDAQGVYCLMLDMYANLPIRDVAYRAGEDFLVACNNFDSQYHFVSRLGLPFLKPAFPAVEPIGGPRLRLCFPQQNTANLLPRLYTKVLHRLQSLLKKFGMSLPIKIENPAVQAFKIPLVKWQRGYAYITSHRLNSIRLAPLTGALLHFKYFQDFSARVEQALQTGEHYNGSSEYKQYAALLAADPALSLVYEGSKAFTNPNQLINLRLMQGNSAWETTCK